jgi:hypothetical protein
MELSHIETALIFSDYYPPLPDLDDPPPLLDDEDPLLLLPPLLLDRDDPLELEDDEDELRDELLGGSYVDLDGSLRVSDLDVLGGSVVLEGSDLRDGSVRVSRLSLSDLRGSLVVDLVSVLPDSLRERGSDVVSCDDLSPVSASALRVSPDPVVLLSLGEVSVSRRE